MKRSIPLLVLLAIAPLGANAAPIFDEDVTPDVIFGSGNANGAFTVDRNNGVELGLRGKLRHNASGSAENTFNSNGDGTYSFAAGVAPTQSFPTAEWSFEWSINTSWTGQADRVLSGLSYELALDSDPGLATAFSTFDPVNDVNPATGTVQWDHAIGDNTTGNGDGTSIPNSASDASGYADLIDNNNVAQNSWKPHWFIGGFDPTVDGTYDFRLSAFDSGSNELARTSMQVIVGEGGTATVPVPAPLALFGLGLVALGFSRARKG